MDDIKKNTNPPSVSQNASSSLPDNLANSQTPKRPLTSSPWDEELPPPVEKKQASPQVIGTLEPSAQLNNKPLKIPSSIEEKVGNKVPAIDYIKNTNQSPPAPVLPVPAQEPSSQNIDSSKSYSNTPFPPSPPVKPTDKLVPMAEMSPQVPTPTQRMTIPPKNNQSHSFVGGLVKKFHYFVLLFVCLFGIVIALTEYGFISVGAEKIYGMVGAEKLWGGLSLDAESSIAQAFLATREETNYKAKGDITLSVDESVESSVISPLVRIVSTSDLKDIDSEATNEPKEIKGTFDLKTLKGASESKIEFKNLSKLTLINNGEDLFVKDSKGEYSGSADKWINYKISLLKDQKSGSGIFGIEESKGYSAKGARVSNEKIDGKRCYKYQIENIEVGNSLSGIGIESSMVEKISGDIWIGVKDKKITKADLKIITPEGSAIRLIGINISFYDFGASNKLTTISETEIVSEKPEEEEVLTSTESATAPLSGDEKRKKDVLDILAALESYKSKTGFYPVARELVKLNSESTSVYKALVPTILQTMPAEPKSQEGWYYAYKSDGIKCSVSARLENSKDPDGILSNGVLLYLKYNND